MQHIRRHKRHIWALLLASAAAIPGAFMLSGALRLGPLSLVPLGIATFAYLYFARLLAGADRGPGDQRRFTHGTAHVDGDELLVEVGDRIMPFPLSAVEGGWIERMNRGTAAVLSTKDGASIAAEFETDASAEAFLAAAGASANKRAVRMSTFTEDTSGRQLSGCLFAGFGLVFFPVILAVPAFLIAALVTWSFSHVVTAGTLAIGAVPCALILAWLRAKIAPTWVHVGTDGVLIRTAFRERFVPHGAIIDAAPTLGGLEGVYHFVTLTLRNGKQAKISVANAASGVTLIERIFAARTSAGAQGRARVIESLARSGRSASEWRQAMSGLVGAATYRTAGLDVEDLLPMVQDATLTPEQRLGAAMAALAHGDDAVKTRVRIAKDACVEPRLHLALDKASSGELTDDIVESVSEATEEMSKSAPRKKAASLSPNRPT